MDPNKLKQTWQGLCLLQTLLKCHGWVRFKFFIKNYLQHQCQLHQRGPGLFAAKESTSALCTSYLDRKIFPSWACSGWGHFLQKLRLWNSKIRSHKATKQQIASVVFHRCGTSTVGPSHTSNVLLKLNLRIFYFLFISWPNSPDRLRWD